MENYFYFGELILIFYLLFKFIIDVKKMLSIWSKQAITDTHIHKKICLTLNIIQIMKHSTDSLLTTFFRHLLKELKIIIIKKNILLLGIKKNIYKIRYLNCSERRRKKFGTYTSTSDILRQKMSAVMFI